MVMDQTWLTTYSLIRMVSPTRMYACFALEFASAYSFIFFFAQSSFCCTLDWSLPIAIWGSLVLILRLNSSSDGANPVILWGVARKYRYRSFFHSLSLTLAELIALVKGFTKFLASEFACGQWGYSFVFNVIFLHELSNLFTWKWWSIIRILCVARTLSIFGIIALAVLFPLQDNESMHHLWVGNGPQKSIWMVCQGSGGSEDICNGSGLFCKPLAWHGIHLLIYFLINPGKPHFFSDKDRAFSTAYYYQKDWDVGREYQKD